MSLPGIAGKVALVTGAGGGIGLGTPHDMAQACPFLLCDAASRISGHILAVDGGQVVRP